MSLINEIMYGSAKDAANAIGSLDEDQAKGLLVYALINALNRIHKLEDQVDRLQFRLDNITAGDN